MNLSTLIVLLISFVFIFQPKWFSNILTTSRQRQERKHARHYKEFMEEARNKFRARNATEPAKHKYNI